MSLVLENAQISPPQANNVPLNFTLSGSADRQLLVAVCRENTTPVFDVTVNSSISMNPVTNASAALSPNFADWYYLNEADLPGAGNIQIRASGPNNQFLMAYEYSGAEQIEPDGDGATATSNLVTSGPLLGAPGGELICASSVGNESTSWEDFPGQVFRLLGAPGAFTGAGSYTKSVSGLDTISAQTTNSQTRSAMASIAIAPAAAAGPVITDVSPSAPQPGQSVTIQGTGFGASQGGNGSVDYGAFLGLAVTSWSDIEIVATWPITNQPGSTLAFNADEALTVTNDALAKSPNYNVQTSPGSAALFGQVATNDSGSAGIFDNDTVAIGDDYYGNWNINPLDLSQADKGIFNGVALPSQFTYQLYDGVWSSAATEDFIEQGTELPPTITGTTPATPEEGQVGVTIQGSNFGEQGIVTYRGQMLTVTNWTDTEITVHWPSVVTEGSLELNVTHQLVVKTSGPFGVVTVPKSGWQYVAVTQNNGIFSNDVIYMDDVCYGRQTTGSGMDFTNLAQGYIDAVPDGGVFTYRLWDKTRGRWSREVQERFTVTP